MERASTCPVELNPKPGYWPGNQHTRRNAALGHFGAEPGTDLPPLPQRGRTVPKSAVGGREKGSATYSFIFQHLLSTCYVPGTGETEEYKIVLGLKTFHKRRSWPMA